MFTYGKDEDEKISIVITSSCINEQTSGKLGTEKFESEATRDQSASVSLFIWSPFRSSKVVKQKHATPTPE